MRTIVDPDGTEWKLKQRGRGGVSAVPPDGTRPALTIADVEATNGLRTVFLELALDWRTMTDAKLLEAIHRALEK
jgi:hypothetical protein